MGLKKAGMVKEFENGFKIEQLAVGRGGGAVAKGGTSVFQHALEPSGAAPTPLTTQTLCL